PDVAVLTSIAESHLQNYRSREQLINEKRTLTAALQKDGIAILNADDATVLQTREKLRTHVTTYGFSEQADVRAVEATLREVTVEGTMGMNWKLVHQGSTAPMFLPGALGNQQVSSA